MPKAALYAVGGASLIYKLKFMFGRKKHKTIDFLKAHERFDDLIEALHLHHKKKKNFFLIFLRWLLVFVLALVLLAVVLAAVLFFRFKGVYDLAISGKSSLQYSIDSAKKQDFAQMLENSENAEGYFNGLLKEIESLRSNILFSRLPVGQEELSDLEYFVRSLALVSKSLSQVAKLGEELSSVTGGQLGQNFAQFTPEEKERLLKMLYESGPELNGVKANLDLALLNLDNVRGKSSLKPLADQIDKIKIRLTGAATQMSRLVLASEIVPKLAGYPQPSTFLMLFQNNDELRPTGGFIGTYGILQTKNGDIVRFDTHDIYHMDMPMEAGKLMQVIPPEPIKKYLNKNWYMRDSNWSPDFPTSAEKALWFYKKENDLLTGKNQINNFNGNFDGVIAITPDFVADLLSVTGPIGLNGEVFSKDNFTKFLQYKVEQDFASQNITSWQRKEIVGTLLGELKDKLFNLDYRYWPLASEVVGRNIENKNILAFFRDQYLEGLARDLNLAGEIKMVDGDYLMLIDSNMAALKTDAVMERKIEYGVAQKSDGLYAKLKIIYTHGGGRDWRTDDYKSYTRIYVPEGSTLVKADGFTYEKGKARPESGKLSIEGFVSVRVGKSTELNIEYKLPKGLEDRFRRGEYSLLVQKQPGNRIKSIRFDLTALGAIKSYEPAAGAKVSGNSAVWTSDLVTDREFEVNF